MSAAKAGLPKTRPPAVAWQLLIFISTRIFRLPGTSDPGLPRQRGSRAWPSLHVEH